MTDPCSEPGWPAGVRLLHVREATSTNTLALRLAAEGEAGPLWVLADRQTAGRGRSGRSWISLEGNLGASLLFTSQAALASAAQLSLVAGVAVIDALQAVGVEHCRLKWPNDILVGAAKAGGVLVESTTKAGRPGFVAVIGIGLNLAAAPELADRSADRLAAPGSELSATKMLPYLADAMDGWLKKWNEAQGFERVRQAWLVRTGPVGESLGVNAGQGRVDGRFAGLDTDGALLLDIGAGRIERFTFGDVTLAG